MPLPPSLLPPPRTAAAGQGASWAGSWDAPPAEHRSLEEAVPKNFVWLCPALATACLFPLISAYFLQYLIVRVGGQQVSIRDGWGLSVQPTYYGATMVPMVLWL